MTLYTFRAARKRKGKLHGEQFFFLTIFFFRKIHISHRRCEAYSNNRENPASIESTPKSISTVIELHTAHWCKKKKNWNKKIKKKVREIIKVNEEETRFDE